MTWFHVLLLDRAGNNLVNADFSPYFRMFFIVKHIYLTLYIAYVCRIAPIYSAHLYLLALLFTSSGPIGSSRSLSRAVRSAHCPVLFAPLTVPCCSLRSLSRAARCARLPAPVCAPADAWSTVDFFVRRPCVACLACPRVCSLRSPPVRGLLAPVVRAYIVASPAVLLLAVLLSPPAANFFEIVCGASISIPPSSAGVGGTTLYCCTG